MSATQEMPYFIRPSKNISTAEKHEAYKAALSSIGQTLEGEESHLVKMVTINCLLKTHLSYCYWVGFYLFDGQRLTVGPYQGTLGCLSIELGRGVCGKAAQTRETQIVQNVHELTQGTAHIACDPNSTSEIVVPIFDKKSALIAVLDIDSTLPASFDEIDKTYLEKLVQWQFAEKGT